MLADSLVRRTLEIIDWFQPKHWLIENPASSLLWKRFQFEKRVDSSYCSYEFAYRKHTTIAYKGATELVLPVCDGPGVCQQMVGKRHREHAQKGGGGSENRYHTSDELHRIPEGLCVDIVRWCEA